MTDVRSSKPIRLGRVAISFPWIGMLWIVSNSLIAQAATPRNDTPSSNDVAKAKIVDVQLGLSGFWKLGYPTQVLVTVEAGTEPLLDGRLELESVDADGVGVIYQTECQLNRDQSKTLAMTTQHGRAARGMHLRLLDKAGQRIAERLISDEERGTVLPVGQPWIVGVGSDMALEQAAMRSATGLLPSYSSCEVSDNSKLPRTAKAYDGIDLLVISTRNWEILEGLASEQQEAISEWIHGGGHALIWLGENAGRVREQPWLAKLIRAEVKGTVKQVDPVLLESFLSSQKRLPPLTCSRLNPDQCLVDLSLQSPDRKKLALIYRSAFGFGQVQVFAADLDASPLREWSERKLLLERLYNESLNMNRESHSLATDPASYLGYTDLSGQIHAALDHFQDVRIGSLSLMAVVLFGIVALLGPFDYFVISKAWRKPAWTWMSLLLWSISTLVGVTLLAKGWKPRGLAVNSIELVDVDYSTSRIRGRGFAHCYSGQAGRFDFSAMARNVLPVSKVDLDNSVDSGLSNDANIALRTQLSWCGQPGYGLGGFDSDVRTDIGFPTYRVLDESSFHETGQESLNDEGVDLVEVGINFAGSKSIRADWSATLKLSNDTPAFSVTATSEFLQGKWTNPMNRDLLDGWLLYRSWLYPMPSRIRSNGSHQISASDIPKDLGRRLQRRQLVQDRDSSIPWDPTDRKDIGRLVEMLTLYQAGGGHGYTGLTHNYWSDLDLSKHLKMNRVIVFGRLAEPVVEWSAKAETKPIDVRDGNRSAYVRFVIPVAVAN